MKRYDAVIFDLFGTLVDSSSYEAVRALLGDMARSLGAPHDGFLRLWLNDTRRSRARGFFPTIEENLLHIARALGAPATAERLRDAVRLRLRFTRSALTPRPDAVAVLEGLGNGGHRRGLVSDCSPDVPLLWPETPLAAHIDAPLFSCAVGLEKPDPRIYHLACERLGVVPSRCLYVGDGDSEELTGARNVGMDAVLIRVPRDRGFRRREDRWTGPRISTLTEVLSLIE